MAFLETQDVTKKFGGLTAVDSVSISIKKGEVFGLIGPNGAGKTTFLNCITGVGAPTSGKVLYKGEDVTGLTPYKMAQRGMCRTFQIVQPFNDMTALDNVLVGVKFGRDQGQHKDEEARAAALLDEVGFDMPKQTLAGNLNTIQLKYMELARALAIGGDMLLLDEVASGLSPSELPEFIALVLRIRDRGMTIIAIEHVMKFMVGICDRLAVLQFGKLIAQGTVQDVLSNPKVTKAYLGEEELH
ncbi:MAG: ABC transporter ATP-binding protein [Desulfobacterium sp.]